MRSRSNYLHWQGRTLQRGGGNVQKSKAAASNQQGEEKRYRPNMLASNSESPLTMYTRMYAHKE